MIDGGEAIRKLALNVARYSGLVPLARPLVGGIGAILMLHRVTATPEKPYGVNRHLNIAPDFLDAVIADMKGNGYAFVSMDEAVERIRDGGKARAVRDDHRRRRLPRQLVEALPVLERHGVPITIYVAPGLIDGTADLWWDVIEAMADARVGLSMETPRGEVTIDCSTPGKKRAADHPAASLSDAGSARGKPAGGGAGTGPPQRHRSRPSRAAGR